MVRKRTKYSDTFKAEAVKMVIDGSRPIATVANELDINPGTLGVWVNKYRDAHPIEEDPLTPAERIQFRELQAENRELRMKNEFLGKSGVLLCPGVSVISKYEFIDGEKANYPVTKMCLWAGVSKSGYYDWRKRPLSATAERREELAVDVRKVFDASDGTYGHRRVHAELGRKKNRCRLELVRRVMVEGDMVACQPRPYRRTTDPDGTPSTADLVDRDFTAAEPGVKLVGDITYIRTWEGWVYLATVIDCFSKMVVGFAMADHMRTGLVIDALQAAIDAGGIQSNAIFHSDHGAQYTSEEFKAFLASNDMVGSMGKTGVCWDNAMAESFFASLKNEFVYRTVFPTRRKAVSGIAHWIEIWYNRSRLHSGIGYRTPVEVHDSYRDETRAA
ncbi:MAG: IS3 family transposase [Candidatus Microthrix sp.]|nr:IS3 family transposase [Candidatus Microthrix sp.]MBK6503298.1 IS3 family transposase [Candidatus Microthrix sp.]